MPVMVKCHICSKQVPRDPSKVKRNARHFCSRACNGEWRKTAFKGKKSPVWKGGEIEKKCLVCSKGFSVKKYRAGTARFCSRQCSSQHHFSKERNPLWKGGVTKFRDRLKSSEVYKSWRKKVYRRDYWTCQECGHKGGSIEAHHIRKLSEHPRLVLKVWNGITLCTPCHKKTYGKEEKFERRYFRKILIDYTPSILRKEIKI